MPTEMKLSRLHPSFYLLSLLIYLSPAPAWASFATALSAMHIQSVLQMQFPAREYTTAARVSLHDPQVLLIKGASNITLMIPVEVNIPGEELHHGHAIVTVGLNYRAMTGELFLHNPHLTEFVMPMVADDVQRELTATVTAMTAKILPLVRIYKVREQDLNHSLDKSALKSMSIDNEKLQLEFGFR